jgi:pseudouridine synthase
MVTERLHKVLAGAGFGSRRTCEQLIAQGQVSVDGQLVTRMGVQVDLTKQKIVCMGQPVRSQRLVTVMLHKPRRVMTTTRDEAGRKTVMDLVAGLGVRVYPVGRLDWDSEGLLLLTNDGELTNLLTHPRYGVPRTYHALLKGELTGEVLGKIQQGVWLAEGRTGPVRVHIKKRMRGEAVVDVTVNEGMNREVRRIFAKFGIKVKRLKRIRVGPLGLGPLPSGAFRVLAPSEVEALRASASQERKNARA